MIIDFSNALDEARMREKKRRDERMYRERDVKNIMFYFGQSLDSERDDKELRSEIDEIFDFDERKKQEGRTICLN